MTDIMLDFMCSELRFFAKRLSDTAAETDDLSAAQLMRGIAKHLSEAAHDLTFVPEA